ncbi:MAG: hypothetical protein ACKVOX_15690 [Rhizobacter sp.]
MSYQGERARPMASENGRVFKVSKLRLAPDGHVSDVLWGEVDAGSDHSVGALVTATATEVVNAIHDGAQVVAVFPPMRRLPDRTFVVVEHRDGRECLSFDGASSPGRDLSDIDRLVD